MRLQAAHPVIEPHHIFHEPYDFALNEMRLLTHTHILENGLNDLDRKHQQ